MANDVVRFSPSGEGGFTLLEMLVALSIISIAALTLVRLDAYAVRSAGDLDERTVAVAASCACSSVPSRSPAAISC